MSEIRFALRRLRRAPGFAAAVVLVLALGIGGATLVFSLVDGILLQPLPYPEPGRLVRIAQSASQGGAMTADQSDALVMLHQGETLAFDGVAAWRFDDGDLRALEEGQSASRVHGARVTANFFGVLGVRPALGRAFDAGEDRPGRNGVVVLSHRFWQERLHGDPGAIGREIVVNDVPRRIVGIMPEGFAYPANQVELWLPLALDPARLRPETFNLAAIARMKRGVSIEAAHADLARVLSSATSSPPASFAPRVESLRDAIVGPPARLLGLLLGVVLLVLVVACTNVAGLFLVRAQRAQVELAVRGALGSGLTGLLAMGLSESLLLSAVGGGIGVWLATVSMDAVPSLGAALSLPRLENVGLDGRVLAFASAITALCAVCVSLLPLLRARRVAIAQVLRGSGAGPGGGPSSQRTRDVLVIGQIAAGLVIVASSGLMTRSLLRLSEVQPGFDAGQTVTARVLLPFARYGAPERLAFFDDLVRRTEAVPGVREVALTDRVPLSGDRRDMVIEVEDRAADDFPVASVDGRYFETLRIPLLRGRTFGTLAESAPSSEAIVSRAFAQRQWPGADPIGKRVRPLDGEWYTIVGEVGDVHYDALDEPASAVVYFPISVPAALSLVVRTDGRGTDALSAIRDIVRSLDETVPTYDEALLQVLVENASARTRALVVLLALASVVTCLLGAVGLYGSIAYSVSLRRRELGIRMMLGARAADVRRMVSLGGLRLAGVGILIGTACTLATSWLLRALLYRVSPADPLTLGGTAVALMLIALVASWIPARRAAGIEPAEALRSD